MTTQNTKLQTMLRELNSDPAIASAYVPLFLFLWLYGKNEIQLKQEELSNLTAYKKRTLRSQLYKLRDADYINYSGHWDVDGKTIEILKFRHENHAQTTT